MTVEMSLQNIYFGIGVAGFVLAAILGAIAARYFFAADIRGAFAELSGRARQEGLADATSSTRERRAARELAQDAAPDAGRREVSLGGATRRENDSASPDHEGAGSAPAIESQPLAGEAEDEPETQVGSVAHGSASFGKQEARREGFSPEGERRAADESVTQVAKAPFVEEVPTELASSAAAARNGEGGVAGGADDAAEEPPTKVARRAVPDDAAEGQGGAAAEAQVVTAASAAESARKASAAQDCSHDDVADSPGRVADVESAASRRVLLAHSDSVIGAEGVELAAEGAGEEDGQKGDA